MKMVLMLGASLVMLAATPLAAQPATSANPLLQPWTGPFGGLPPFDKVRIADIQPAMEEAMRLREAEIAAIANNRARPTFENTLIPYERAGAAMDRAQVIYDQWTSNLSTPEVRKIEAALAPKLSAHRDRITQNERLFARIEAVWNSPDKARWTPEQRRLAWVYYNRFVLAGAKLDAAKKAELSKVNQQLATLYATFSQNQLADEENDMLVLDRREQLAGLPQSQIDDAAAEAARRKLPGKWVIANTRSSAEPFLTYSTDRALREKAFRMWMSRGDNGNANDNNKVVVEILKLRKQKANLLGYPTFAHWRLADTMAKTPDNALNLMLSVHKAAAAQVRKDVADMQAIVDAEKGGFKIQPWDYRFYAEKVRKAKYDLDLAEVKPYLQYAKVREAMFWTAGQLYGFQFSPMKGVATFAPGMSVFEVKDAAGRHVGVVYFDPNARPGKNSGAWMSEYRTQQKLNPATPIVSQNLNFVGGGQGEPTTLAWDDANTLFHEFGHAIHGLLSNVTYPSIAGTNTTRDFVEFPSQLNENWMTTPEVLKFLVNERGEPIPQALIDKIKRARTFNQGFATTEAQASAIVDMKLHLADPDTIEPRAFEKATLAEINEPAEIVMRHRIPAFGHIFSGEGYAAGYYSYIWAEVLDHDVFAAFTEAGNPWDKATAKRLRDDLLSVGNTVDPAEAFRKFRGRDPKPDALLESKGFTAQ